MSSFKKRKLSPLKEEDVNDLNRLEFSEVVVQPKKMSERIDDSTDLINMDWKLLDDTNQEASNTSIEDQVNAIIKNVKVLKSFFIKFPG